MDYDAGKRTQWEWAPIAKTFHEYREVRRDRVRRSIGIDRSAGADRRSAPDPSYGVQVGDTCVTVSTFSFGALADIAAPVALARFSTLPEIVTL